MMRRYIIAALALSVILFPSCQKEGNAELQCYVVSGQQLPYTGGSLKTVISCNTDWEATCESAEVSVEPSKGRGDMEVTITVPANPGKADRSFNVKFVAKLKDKTQGRQFIVSQSASPFILCEEADKSIGDAGGMLTFYVNSNMSWSVTGIVCDGEPCDDLSVVPEKHGINGVDVRVLVPANETGESRLFQINVALDDFPEEKIVLKIFQDA